MHTHLDMYSPHLSQDPKIERKGADLEIGSAEFTKGAPWWCSLSWHKVPTHLHFYRSVQPSPPRSHRVQQLSPKRSLSMAVLSKEYGLSVWYIVSEWSIVQVTWLIRPRTPVWPLVQTPKKSRLGRRLLHHRFTPYSKPFSPISESLTFTPNRNRLAQDGAQF